MTPGGLSQLPGLLMFHPFGHDQRSNLWRHAARRSGSHALSCLCSGFQLWRREHGEKCEKHLTFHEGIRLYFNKPKVENLPAILITCLI